MAFGLETILALVAASGTLAGGLSGLFGGGGATPGKGTSEIQEALLQNLLQQQRLGNVSGGQYGQMSSMLSQLLNRLGNDMGGAADANTQQTNDYTELLKQMMGYGTTRTDQSTIGLMNQLQHLVSGSSPSDANIQMQQQLREQLMRNASASQLSPEQIQAQQGILNQALATGQNPSQAWNMGPNVQQVAGQQITAPQLGAMPHIAGTDVNAPMLGAMPHITAPDQQTMSDRMSGTLRRQAGAELAAQGINSPALTAEASAQAMAPYEQQMGEFAAQQQMQAMLANQGVDVNALMANQSYGMQGQLANQGNALQVALANQGVDVNALTANQQATLQALLANQGVDMQGQLANQQANLTGAGMSHDLYSQLLSLPGILGPGTGNQQNMATQASQLFASPDFDLSQLSSLTQMLPANPYTDLFTHVGSVNAPGPQNVEKMLQQLFGMMSPTAATGGTPSYGGGGSPGGFDMSGLLPLMLLLQGGGSSSSVGMGSAGGDMWTGGDVTTGGFA